MALGLVDRGPKREGSEVGCAGWKESDSSAPRMGLQDRVETHCREKPTRNLRFGCVMRSRSALTAAQYVSVLGSATEVHCREKRPRELHSGLLIQTRLAGAW